MHVVAACRLAINNLLPVCRLKLDHADRAVALDRFAVARAVGVGGARGRDGRRLRDDGAQLGGEEGELVLEFGGDFEDADEDLSMISAWSGRGRKNGRHT